MAKKEQEPKIILEREYIVPLRKKFINTPQYKRTPKAVKALKQFIAKHMKVSERDVEKVKLDRYLNLELWHRGIRKPNSKIKVKAKKFDSGNVVVELVDIPEALKWKIEKEQKVKKAEVKKEEEKTVEKKPVDEKKEETEEEKKAKEEKQEAVEEVGLMEAEKRAKQRKHEIRGKQEQPKVHRMALQK